MCEIIFCLVSFLMYNQRNSSKQISEYWIFVVHLLVQLKQEQEVTNLFYFNCANKIFRMRISNNLTFYVTQVQLPMMAYLPLTVSSEGRTLHTSQAI